jgi:hypothetical protein
MVSKPLLKRFLGLFDPTGTKKYITQITLILLSLYIATSVDRCKETQKDRSKLKEYMAAIQVDLRDELETNEMNLIDCDNDAAALIKTIVCFRKQHPDSLLLGLNSFASVYWRGVFRSFPPNTFELMIESGEAPLLKNIALRKKLAEAFAFSRTVLKPDLENYDKETQICMEKMGEHINLAEFVYSENPKISCIKDLESFKKSSHNEVFQLHRVASIRGFHLSESIKTLKELDKELADFISTL